MENQVRSSKYQKLDGRDDLINTYRKYVNALVTRMIRAMGLPPDLYDELVAAGYLGLVEAAERYDSRKGAQFKTFATLRVRGAVIDCIRSNSSISGKAYRFAKAMQAVQDLREASVSIEERGNDDKAELARMLELAAQGALVYQLSSTDVEQQPDLDPRAEENPELALERGQFRKILRDLVATLPEKERIVIEAVYFSERTFKEVADTYEGMSKSWVSRLHTRAIRLLSEKLKAFNNN